MLSLEAVLRHPALCGMRCVAGRGGLARGVANVAFLDYEPTQGLSLIHISEPTRP